MVEFSDVISSADFRQKVKLLLNGIFENRPMVERPEKEKSFAKMALGANFDARSSIDVLLDERPTYFGHREMLYAGLVAWVLNPKEESLRWLCLGTAASRCISEAEQALPLGEEDTEITDFVVRHFILGPQFLQEIYYPLNGAQSLMDASSFDLDSVLINSADAIWTVVRATGWFHFVSANFRGNEEYFKPSVNKAVEMIEDHDLVKLPYARKIVGRSAFFDAWTNRRVTIALLYSASTIPVADGTFLHEILKADFNFSLGNGYLRQWLARARYVCDFVLSEMAEPTIAQENLKALRSIKPESFEVPALADIEKKAIYSVFGRTAKAKKYK
ncbi:hypothetical protein N2601_16910 [Rhizobium sp. CB3060]|uniref:hypothetical protein n=1 Tax=Rhizobium sp. CB3060 TaxID=3138255 RepID=UPI0021A34338|nr:hypothetical protein [Rhizobium tropici]UWU20921.1 hypothetical protein N2601_16910 [Rhizobium tropici]